MVHDGGIDKVSEELWLISLSLDVCSFKITCDWQNAHDFGSFYSFLETGNQKLAVESV